MEKNSYDLGQLGKVKLTPAEYQKFMKDLLNTDEAKAIIREDRRVRKIESAKNIEIFHAEVLSVKARFLNDKKNRVEVFHDKNTSRRVRYVWDDSLPNNLNLNAALTLFCDTYGYEEWMDGTWICSKIDTGLYSYTNLGKRI